MPTEEELAQQEAAEAEAIAQLEADEAKPVTTPEVPDEAAIEARLREKMEAEYADRLRAQTPVAQAQEPDLDELQFSDPTAYRTALAKQIRAEVMGDVAPLLNRLNADLVTNELSEGLGQHGKAYVRQFASGIPAHELEKNPQIRDLVRNAAENVDRKAQPAGLRPERPTATGSTLPISAADYKTYLDAGLSKAEIEEIVKETKGK